MKRATSPIWLILILLSLLGCEPPEGQAGDEDVKVSIENLGPAGSAKALQVWSYALPRTEGDDDPGYVKADLDLNTNELTYVRYCSNEKQMEGSVDIDADSTAALQDLFVNQDICRKDFEVPPNHAVCLAMMLPLATVTMDDDSELNLFLAGKSICSQSLTYFCDSDVEQGFLADMADLVGQVPGCQSN